MFSPNDFDIVDLSVTLDNNPHTDPPPLLPKIDYMDHQEGWPEMEAMFPGLTLDQLPGNESWAAERAFEQFTTAQLAEKSGFSQQTILKYLKTSRYFIKVKRGLYEARNPAQRNSPESN